MEVRRTKPDDDFAAIADIYVSSWKSAYRGIVPGDYLDALNGSMWLPLLTGGKFESFVILDSKTYAGTASVCAARDSSKEGWGELVSIYLLPGYFGRGYAEPLLRSALGALKTAGYGNAYLWVLAENARARSFYEKHGFEFSGDTTRIDVGGKDLAEVRYTRRL